MTSGITEILKVSWMSWERRIILRMFQKVRNYTQSGKSIPGQVNKLK